MQNACIMTSRTQEASGTTTHHMVQAKVQLIEGQVLLGHGGCLTRGVLRVAMVHVQGCAGVWLLALMGNLNMARKVESIGGGGYDGGSGCVAALAAALAPAERRGPVACCWTAAAVHSMAAEQHHTSQVCRPACCPRRQPSAVCQL